MSVPIDMTLFGCFTTFQQRRFNVLFGPIHVFFIMRLKMTTPFKLHYIKKFMINKSTSSKFKECTIVSFKF